MEMLETKYGIFTNNKTAGKSAEEVYQEWLTNKDKPPGPTEIELLNTKIVELETIIDTMLTGGAI